jgi:hypothetical protein
MKEANFLVIERIGRGERCAREEDADSWVRANICTYVSYCHLNDYWPRETTRRSAVDLAMAAPNFDLCWLRVDNYKPCEEYLELVSVPKSLHNLKDIAKKEKKSSCWSLRTSQNTQVRKIGTHKCSSLMRTYPEQPSHQRLGTGRSLLADGGHEANGPFTEMEGDSYQSKDM